LPRALVRKMVKARVAQMEGKKRRLASTRRVRQAGESGAMSIQRKRLF
jgi:hypothetical protein